MREDRRAGYDPWFARALVALCIMVLVAAIASVAHGASSPPAFSVIGTNALETAGSVNVSLSKSAKASSYSKVAVSTVDGTAKAGVDYQPLNTTITVANNTLKVTVPITLIARPGYQGDRSLAVKITCVRFCTIASASAGVTILESEQPPAPTPTPVPPPVTPPTSDPRLIAGVTQACWNGYVISVSATCPAFPSGVRMTVIADEQAVPKVSAALGYTYGESLYRTVHAGETVIVGANEPDLGCACAGQRRAAVAYGVDGKYIGELWYDNLK